MTRLYIRNVLLKIITCTFICLAACTYKDKQAIDPKSTKTAPTIGCAAYGEKYYLYDSLDLRKANLSIQGDIKTSREIVTQLLSKGGDATADPLSACRLIFWTELSAQNGDIHSVYELATYGITGDGYRCLRTKYWAKIGLARLGEFKEGMLVETNEKDIHEDLILREKQMKFTLRKKCAPL